MKTLLAMLSVSVFSVFANAQEVSFSSKTIDIGVVVGDITKSVDFYTKALGFKEQSGFKVPAGFATDAGLTDNQPLDIRVLVLGEGEGATKLKLMQIPGAKSKKQDGTFIHSQLGVSYLTLHVTDTTKAVERLKKLSVKTLAKSPVGLPKPLPQGVFLTLVRDPDGNIIELVGPKN